MVADRRDVGEPGGERRPSTTAADPASAPGAAPDRPADGALDFKHAATYGAVGLVLFTLLKAYASANFSLTTAAALLTTAPISVLLGTMVSYSYQIFPLLFMAFAAWTVVIWRSTGWGPLATGTTVCAVIALLVSPPSYLWQQVETVLIVALSLVLCAKLVISTKKTRWVDSRLGENARAQNAKAVSEFSWPRFVGSPSFAVAVLAIAVAIMILRTLTSLWLPVEVLVYRQTGTCEVTVQRVFQDSKNSKNRKWITTAQANGCRKMIGHVLSSDDHWTTVVAASDRGLRRIPTDDIKYRELCHQSDVQPGGASPLLWTITGRDYWSPNTTCSDLANRVEGATLEPEPVPRRSSR